MVAKKRVLTPEEAIENQKLKEIFNERKKKLGLTQETLSEKLGISQGGLNHYLNGANPLNPTIASQFAKELDITVNAFSQRIAGEISKMAKTIDEYQAFSPIFSDNNTLGNYNTIGGISNHHYHAPDIAEKDTLKMPDQSLAPVIPQGSELWLDTQQTEIQDGKIYWVEYSGAKWFRRLFRLTENRVRLAVFDNKNEFPEHDVSGEALKVLGQVKAWKVTEQ